MVVCSCGFGWEVEAWRWRWEGEGGEVDGEVMAAREMESENGWG